jgi:hypothetical protein
MLNAQNSLVHHCYIEMHSMKFDAANTEVIGFSFVPSPHSNARITGALRSFVADIVAVCPGSLGNKNIGYALKFRQRDLGC